MRSRQATRTIVSLGVAGAVWLGSVSASTSQQPAAPGAATVPTFSKDVAPILYKHCTSCHRPGQIAPMSLLTYADARPYARAIYEEVEAGHMPPWHAEAAPGTFLNERRLSATEKATLIAWATRGAPEGDAKDLPARPVYADGWRIGKPDVIFEGETYQVPATGSLSYEHFFIETNFTSPKFLKAVEVRPGDRSVVHHVLAYYRATPDLQRTLIMSVLDQSHSRLPTVVTPPGRYPSRPGGKRLIGSYAPGADPQIMPAGTALRLEPGGVIELEVHYTTSGTATTDRTSIGFIYATDPAPREVLASAFLHAQFTLPAGAANVPVETGVQFVQDVTVWGLFPHTHLRGKRWQYVALLPDGTKRIVLDIPRYDPNWQTYYIFKDPLQLPAGAQLIGTAWYDNSAKNPANPNPNVDVRWGEQIWDEMQYTGILVSPVKAAIPRLSNYISDYSSHMKK